MEMSQLTKLFQNFLPEKKKKKQLRNLEDEVLFITNVLAIEQLPCTRVYMPVCLMFSVYTGASQKI